MLHTRLQVMRMQADLIGLLHMTGFAVKDDFFDCCRPDTGLEKL